MKKKFRTIKCPKCGQIQVSSAKILVCKFCGHHTTIFTKNEKRMVAIYDERDNATEARQFVQELKNEIINKRVKE